MVRIRCFPENRKNEHQKRKKSSFGMGKRVYCGAGHLFGSPKTTSGMTQFLGKDGWEKTTGMPRLLECSDFRMPRKEKGGKYLPGRNKGAERRKLALHR